MTASNIPPLTSASSEIQLSQQNPELLAKFIDFAPASMAMFDRQMCYLAVNRAWRAEFGLGDQSLVGRSHYDVFPNIPEQWKYVHRRCLAGAVEKRDEDSYVRADGTVHWLRWEVHPWRDAAGEIGGIVFFSEDITASKRATERVQEAIEAVPTGMLMIDGAGTMVLVNAQIEHMFGYSRSELLGQPVEMLIPKRHRAQHPPSRQAFSAEPSTRAMGKGRELYGLHKNGNEIPIEIGLNPLNTSEGKFVLSSVVDISERKRVEATLRESEWRFRELGSHSIDVIWIIGLHPHRVLYVSPAVESVWGISPSQNYQDPRLWEQIVHPEDRERILRAWAEASVPGAESRFDQEYRIVRPDGSTRWLSDILTPFRDAASNVVGLSGVSRDITDRKRSEIDRSETEHKLQALFHSTRLGLALTNMNARFVDANESYCRMTGYSVAELRALDFREITVAEDLAVTEEQFALAKRTGHFGPFKKTYLRKDGTRITLELNGALFRGADGQNYCWTIFEDITERNRADAALRASERKNRVLFDAAIYASALNSLPDRVILEVNDAWVRLFGYSREEAIGRTALELGIIADDSTRAAALRAVGSTGELHDYEWDFVTKTGKVVSCLVDSVRVVVDGDDYNLVTSRDVTEQRRLERAVLESTSAEQQKLGRDLHDGLGQELTGIAMLATAVRTSLKKDGRPEAAILEKLETVARQAIANCRAIAHGLSPVEYAPGGLIGILNEMVTLQRDSFGVDAHLTVRNAESLRLTANAAENLYRIAQEAVTNARRHGQAKAIEVSLTVHPDSVVLEIRDTGVGFAATVPTTTGMGLKTMRLRAAAIGGVLSIGAGSRGGTVVVVECPQRVAES